VRRYVRSGFVVLLAVTFTVIVVNVYVYATWSSPAAGGVSSTDSGAAALVGEQVVSLEDVDERWRRMSPTEHAQAMQTLYEGRKAALDGVIGDLLIERAAKRGGASVDAAAESAISARARPVTDEDVLAFYASNSDQLHGQSLEELRPGILRLLETRERARARRDFVNELAGSGPTIRILLAPPRRPIEVGAMDPSIGSDAAPVTLVAFSDFQCPFCARVEPTLKRIRDAYSGRVRLVWKDFPLTTIHPDAFKAAEASHCAGEQDKYWPYHDRLFANQRALAPHELIRHAREVGLDVSSFSACLESSKYQRLIQANLEAGAHLGVESTPTIFINGRLVSGAQPYETFAALVDEELDRAAAR
jgi:protein-disulfide isomerase